MKATLETWLPLELRARNGIIFVETDNETLATRQVLHTLAAVGHWRAHWTPAMGEAHDEVRDGGLASGEPDRDLSGMTLLDYLPRIADEIRGEWGWGRGSGGVITQTGSNPLERAWVINGAGIWLDPNARDFCAITTRYLVELMVEARLRHSTLVIIVPSGTMICPSLSRLASHFEDPLPTREYLAGTLWPEFLQGASALVACIRPDDVGEHAVDRLTGMSRDRARNALTSSLVHAAASDDPPAEFLRLLGDAKGRALKDSAALEARSAVPIEDVGGLSLLKTWVRRRKVALSPAARELNIPSPAGVMLLGVPGSGKSLVAAAIASVLEVPLVRFDFGAVFGGVVGQSEGQVRTALRTAAAVAPCVLHLDEIEKAMGGGDRDGGTSSRVFGTFLSWLSDRDPTAPSVFCVMTANDVSRLPPELLRRGRLDEIFFVDLPTNAVRMDIMRVLLARANRGLAPEDRIALTDENMGEIARRSKGFTGAELEAALSDARITAYSDGDAFTMGHMRDALAAVVPLSASRAESINALRAWASARCRYADPPEVAEPRAPQVHHDMKIN